MRNFALIVGIVAVMAGLIGAFAFMQLTSDAGAAPQALPALPLSSPAPG
jgi:hypothetical protein